MPRVPPRAPVALLLLLLLPAAAAAGDGPLWPPDLFLTPPLAAAADDGGDAGIGATHVELIGGRSHGGMPVWGVPGGRLRVWSDGDR
eukprot:gene31362-48128_t